MANVAYIRPEVTLMKRKWDLVRDCLQGEHRIKERRELYLPMPNPTDKSKKNKERYAQYLQRASFYPVTEMTCEGLLGQVFDVDPIIEVPDDFDFIKEDATGSGIKLRQAAQMCLAQVLSYGRYGILVDYPDMETVTRQDVQLGFARPILAMYTPFDIINWRVINKGAKTLLTLVVFAECYVISDDGFEVKEGYQWRVCRCDETTEWKYQVELWEEDGNDYVVREIYSPTDANGNPLEFIPFTFVGSMNNDPSPDQPPLYGIASLNIKHYRNSADYEDSVYMVGQPTPVATGLDKTWVDEVLNGKMELGSRGIVPLPKGATFTLAQVTANGMVKEAMDQKEQQLVALGAQLIQPQNVSRTLGEAKMDKNTQTSILAKCAQNVNDAFTLALSWCGLFMHGEAYDPNEVYLQLSTTFAITKLSPQEQQQLIANWQGGAITFNEMRAQLRMGGIATEDDEQAKAEIEADEQQRAALALDQIAEAGVNPGSNPNDPQNQPGDGA
jgi:hypothetical protein